MVLTPAHTTLFFENGTQMDIPHVTVLELVNEGIDTVDDLSEIDKDTIGLVAYRLSILPTKPSLFVAT